MKAALAPSVPEGAPNGVDRGDATVEGWVDWAVSMVPLSFVLGCRARPASLQATTESLQAVPVGVGIGFVAQGTLYLVCQGGSSH